MSVVRSGTGSMTPLGAAVVVLCIAAATIGGAWAFQAAGYAPCELCLEERFAYYAGIPLAALVALAAARGAPRLLVAAGLVLIALIFAANAVLGAYHAGIEWGFWPGPAECTGSTKPATSFEEFQRQLKGLTVVRCDAAAIRIAGLSLAGWNALVSLGLAIVAAVGVARQPVRP